MWLAAAAAVLGVLVAAATGENSPSWWLLTLIVAVPGAVSIGMRFRHQPHRWAVAVAPAPERAAVAERHAGGNERSGWTTKTTAPEERTRPRPLAAADWDVVSEISCALGPRQLEWLRSNDFATPWLDSDARAVIEVEPLLAQVVGRPFAPGLDATLRALADAVHAFVEDYSHNTFPDPVVRGGDWRFFEWDDRVLAAEDGNGAGRWAGRSKRLQQLADGVALAYGDFSAAALRNPKVRRRVTARA
jgi:hypothetical protein